MHGLTRAVRSHTADDIRKACRCLAQAERDDFPERLLTLERELTFEVLLPAEAAEELAELRNAYEGWGRWFVAPAFGDGTASLHDLRDVLEPPPSGSPEGSVVLVHVICELTALEWYLLAHHVDGKLRITSAPVDEEASTRERVLVGDLKTKIEDLDSEDAFQQLNGDYVEQLGAPGNHYEMWFTCGSRAELLARLELVEGGIREQIDFQPGLIAISEDTVEAVRTYRCGCGERWEEPLEEPRAMEATCPGCKETQPLSRQVRVRA